MRYFLSSEATKDLDQIWDYLVEETDLSTANIILSDVKKTFHLLSEFPEIGRTRDDLALGLRNSLCRNYIIFYRIVQKNIEIVRVIHGRRNLTAFFQKSNP